MSPKIAIVRPPSSSMCKCISSHPQHKSFNLAKVKLQHQMYCETLESLGLEVIYLETSPNDPDSCFVEDTAIIHRNKAVVCRMGAEARRREVIGLQNTLEEYLAIETITSPGTIEGGDIIHLPNEFFCGVTQRTNQEGMNQMSTWLNVRVTGIKIPNIVHLKSYITYIDNNLMIGTEEFSNHPAFKYFDYLTVRDDESYAANTLTISKTVLMPKGYSHTKNLVESEGYEVIDLEMSEFQKCEGALTCLSLLI